MDKWEELGRRVPGMLMLVGSGGMEAVTKIELAHSKLQERATLVRRIRQGMPAAMAFNHFDDPDPVGVCATVTLEEARCKISQNAARHAMAGHVFIRYAAHHGIQHEPPCTSWGVHFYDAIDLTDKALEKVSEAASHAEAAKVAFDFVIDESLLIQPQLKAEWAFAAQELVDHAAYEATMALDDLRLARHAVALEFFDAWTILRRGREAMHQWRELELTVPGTLVLIGTAGMEVLRLIEVADSKFQERIDLLRDLRNETPANVAVNNFQDPDPEGVCPTAILENARREISQTAARHAKAHHIFVHYAAYLGIQEDALYRIWDANYQNAVSHTDKALRRVINAVSNAEAGKDAVGMFVNLPYMCPLWEEWALEAQNFMSIAALNAIMAMDDVRRARRYVAFEFFDAWKILRRSGVLRLDDSASRG